MILTKGDLEWWYLLLLKADPPRTTTDPERFLRLIGPVGILSWLPHPRPSQYVWTAANENAVTFPPPPWHLPLSSLSRQTHDSIAVQSSRLVTFIFNSFRLTIFLPGSVTTSCNRCNNIINQSEQNLVLCWIFVF